MNPKDLLKTFYARFSGQAKNQSDLDAFMTDEKLKQHIGFFEAAFPNYELYIQDIIGEGDKVAVRVLFKGVHEGELAGIAATSKKVELPFVAIYEFKDGRISDHWLGADQMALIGQLQGEPEMAV
jgi:predicted ester cyclase